MKVSLGITLDRTRQEVTRGNRPPVSLGGNCKQWAILTELWKRYDNYYLLNDLRATVWADEGYLPEDSTVWALVSELRKRLRPLRLTIKHTKGLGYRLEHLPVS
jgi:DNA-binding response OmpR family regulator